MEACFDLNVLTEVRTMHEPMPLSLPVPTEFKVTDSNGRLVRSEELPTGTTLPDRLRLAHRNYTLQGWTVDPLLPGRWSFIAEKAGQRLLIGIRRPGTGYSTAGSIAREPSQQPAAPAHRNR